MLVDPEDAGVELVAALRPDMFYLPANRVLFGELAAMIAAGERVDGFLVRARLEARGLLDAIGGALRLVDVADLCPTAGNAIAYAAIVAETAALRALEDAATTIVRDVRDNGHEGAAALAERAEAELARAIERRVSGDAAVPLATLVQAEIQRIEAGEQAPGLATGFVDLDRLLGGGFKPAELVVLAGRPSMGKSALASAIARHVATRPEPAPVFYVSLEVPGSQLTANLLAQEAGLDAMRVRGNRLSPADKAAALLAGRAIAAAPFVVVDAPRLTIASLRARARLARIRQRVGLVVVDYLQLVDAALPGRVNREQEIAAVARGLKQIARELDVPVLALAQLNRGAEAREGHRPRLSDLRESGAIEADADVVMLMFREAYYAPHKAEVASLAEVIVAKNRNGPTGSVKLYFDRASLRFADCRRWGREVNDGE